MAWRMMLIFLVSGYIEITLCPLAVVTYFKSVISKLILWIDILRASFQIVVRWMPRNSIDDKSTLVQVVTWCHQAASHCLSQCWPKSLLPYCINRPTISSRNVKIIDFSLWLVFNRKVKLTGLKPTYLGVAIRCRGSWWTLVQEMAWCNGFSWTNVDLSSFESSSTNFGEISIKIQSFSIK